MFAALAARHGYRVAVLGQRARANTYRHEGALFFRRPERFYGFSTSPAIARVFGELSLTMEMRTLPKPINPTLQVAMPGTRLDILRDGDRWRRELEREFPGTGRILETFDVWADDRRKATDPLLASNHLLPPNGFRANAKYRKLLESVPTLRELLDKTATPGMGPLEASPRGAPTRAMVEGVIGHLATLG